MADIETIIPPVVTPEVIPEVVPEVVPETTPEVIPEVTPEIVPDVIPDEETVGLKAEIAKLQKELLQLQTDSSPKLELDQANTLLQGKDALVTEYESLLTGIIDTKLEAVPENIKELVPTNLSLKERLDWLTKAEKSGIFKPAVTVNPDIEIGKPLTPKDSKLPADTSKLSASAIMALAYGSSNGKGRK